MKGAGRNGEYPPLKGQTAASQRRDDKEEGRDGKGRGEESSYDLGQKGRKTREDGWTDGEKVLYGEYAGLR